MNDGERSALQSCLDELTSLSQQRKTLLDQIWVLERDAQVIREKMANMRKC